MPEQINWDCAYTRALAARLCQLRTSVVLLLTSVAAPSHRADGEPLGLCKETAANSGIFEREWTKAKIAMDCNSWTPTITLK